MTEKLTIKCIDCGTMNTYSTTQEKVFCSECGKELTECIKIEDTKSKESTEIPTQTILCLECKQEIPLEADFCPFCGKELKLLDKTNSQDNNKTTQEECKYNCPNCGKKLYKLWDYCPSCGYTWNGEYIVKRSFLGNFVLIILMILGSVAIYYGIEFFNNVVFKPNALTNIDSYYEMLVQMYLSLDFGLIAIALFITGVITVVNCIIAFVSSGNRVKKINKDII